MRHKSLAIFDAGLQLPSGAGAGKVLTSDASGNGSWGAGGGGSVSEIVAMFGQGASQSPPQTTYTKLPGGTYYPSAGASDYFRANADGTLTILKDGWYDIFWWLTENAISVDSGVIHGVWFTTDDTSPANPSPHIRREESGASAGVPVWCGEGMMQLPAGYRIGVSVYNREATVRTTTLYQFVVAKVGGVAGPQGDKGDPGGVTVLNFGQALPSSPADGDQVIWRPDTTAMGAARAVQWHMIALAGNWYCVKGTPAVTNAFPQWTLTTPTLNAVNQWSGGAGLVVPATGTWLIEFGPTPGRAASGHAVLSQVSLGAIKTSVPSSFISSMTHYFPALGSFGATLVYRDEVGLTSGDVLRMAVAVANVTSTFVLGSGDVRMQLTPILIPAT